MYSGLNTSFISYKNYFIEILDKFILNRCIYATFTLTSFKKEQKNRNLIKIGSVNFRFQCISEKQFGKFLESSLFYKMEVAPNFSFSIFGLFLKSFNFSKNRKV